MSDWKEHVKDCEAQLGNGWEMVHKWLDEYARIYWHRCIHRVHRHHIEGVEEVRSKWVNFERCFRGKDDTGQTTCKTEIQAK